MIDVVVRDDGARILIKGLSKRVSRTSPLLERIGEYIVSSTQRKIKDGIEPPNAPLTKAFKKGSGTPLMDTGRLMSSIAHRLEDKHTLVVGTPLIYARIHQEGGVIKARRAKKLAIPASWLTRSLMREEGVTPRKLLDGLKQKGWKIWFTPSAIMGRAGKRGKKRLLFVRKESVEIPKRRYLHISDYDKKVIRSMILNHIRR